MILTFINSIAERAAEAAPGTIIVSNIISSRYPHTVNLFQCFLDSADPVDEFEDVKK